MFIEIIPRPKAEPAYANKFLPLRPLRISEIQYAAVNPNPVRERAVRETVAPGDVCFIIERHDIRGFEIFHCNSGKLLTGWYADWLLFMYADDVQKIVLAKPTN